METIFLLIPMLFAASDRLSVRDTPPVAVVKPSACRFFGKDYAVKMAGRNVKAQEEENGENAEGTFSKCTFVTDVGGPKIYFMLIESGDEAAAKKAFDSIRQSNKAHKGFEEWLEVADEAIVHTDGENFQFVMIRKGAKTIRLKLNPVGKVSIDVTKAVAMALETRL